MLKHLKLTFIVAVAIFFFAHGFICQTGKENILEKYIDADLKGENIYQICAILSVSKGIPIGFEANTDFDSDKDNVSIEIKAGTVREILDLLVKKETNYSWELRDGVINVYPIRLRDETLKTLLETKIKNFSWKKDAGKLGIIKSLSNLDEVNTTVNSKQIRLSIAITDEFVDQNAIANIDVSDTNLRGVLNKIILDANTHRRWMISREEDGAVFLVF